MTENPYESPAPRETQPDRMAVGEVGLGKGLAFVGMTTMLGGLLGMLVGLLLGKFMPEYYHAVFSGAQKPGFDPVAAGVGLGITQGLMIGALCGVGLTAVICWHQRKLKQLEARPEPRA